MRRLVGAWKRRYDAASRLAPLDCGCVDPLLCDCTQPPLTDVAVDSWRDAANWVLAAGLTPLVPLEVLQRLWARGGPDRELASRLHAAVGGRAA